MMSRSAGSISFTSTVQPQGSLYKSTNHGDQMEFLQPNHGQTPMQTRATSSTGLNHHHNPFSSNQDSWGSNFNYGTSLDVQSAAISSLPFSTHHTESSIVTSAWSPQDAMETAGWSDASGTTSFPNTTQVSDHIDWESIESATSPWSHSVSSTEAFHPPTPTVSTPYRQQSFWAYKRQGATEPPMFADMEMTAEIPYPAVYSTASQILSTPIHPAFTTNMADVESLDFAIPQEPPSFAHETLVSDPSVRQAVTGTRIKTQSRLNTSSTHTHSHGAISKTKTAPKGGRVGPLTITQREKVEDMRSYGACWRCRKYKKPCNGPGICNTCVTSGFRVWPSALGCRRGDFDSFAFGMIPTHSEQIIGQILPIYPKPPGWRQIAQVYRSELLLPQSAANGDKLEQIMLKVQTTQLTGPGVMELLQIACNLQRGLAKDSRVLANTLKGLGHACDFYSCFVATDENPSILRGRFDVINIFTHNRKALLTTLSSFLNSCLTGRMRDWLPTFLSANFIIFTFVMLSDAAVMVPSQFRDRLWTSIRGNIMDFRGILYPMAQDLLSALGKGSKLLHMQCWNMVEVPSETPGEQPTWERNREGMKILDGDVAIFDGLRALQLWLERFGPLMRGDVWYSTAPHTVDVLPICSWERMFDFSPRG